MMQSSRRPLVAGNWKMNGSAEMARSLTQAIIEGGEALDAELAVIPPYPYLGEVRQVIEKFGSDIALGGQDVSMHDAGAHTGEVSGAMLKDCGCRYVLVGHSERRHDHHESNSLVAKKFAAAQHHGLTPILCVGETLDQRNKGQTDGVVLAQLEAVIELAGIESLGNAVVAYEPVWAIGTGETATPEQAQTVHASIRARIRASSDTIGGQVRILYGGSVKPDNAADILSCEDIDGGLIGGASLEAESFLGIARAI